MPPCDSQRDVQGIEDTFYEQTQMLPIGRHERLLTESASLLKLFEDFRRSFTIEI